MKARACLRYLGPVVGLALLLAAWWFAGLWHSGSILMPSPVEVGRSLVRLLADSGFLSQVWQTASKTCLALAIGGIVGVSAGLVIGIVPFLRWSLSLPVHLIRSVPVTALIPLFIVLVGSPRTAGFGLACFGTVFVVLAYTLIGLANVSQARLLYARTAGARKGALLTKVILYEALPSIATGLRVSVSLALVLVVVAEIVMGGAGLGKAIHDFRYQANYAEMYATIALTGALGYVLNAIAEVADRTVVHWRGR